MSSEQQSEQQWEAATEAAWAGFRGRLADHTAAMDDDDVLIVEFDGVVADDEDGAAPYVQLCAYGGTQVQVEAVSNHWLHERCALSAADEALLLDLGWEAAQDREGWENFHLSAERRAADEVAVLAVRTLREVYGVPHPAFLAAGGLEVDPRAAPMSAPVAEADGEEPVATFAADRERLQSLVDAAMEVVYTDLKHDDDGDIPIRSGKSLVFVRVLEDRPSVEIFAELVIDVPDAQLVRLELEVLNAIHSLWKFVLDGTLVTMRYELPAVPFAPFQLRAVVDRFVTEVDDIARAVSLRVGGRRFFEAAPEVVDTFVASDDTHPAMVGLLELLHLGKLRPATVAGLFDHDRLEIIRQIVRIRRGIQSCEEHDEELVLTALRRALRLVSDGDSEVRPVPQPPRPRSVQESLLSGDDLGEDSLDLGWSA